MDNLPVWKRAIAVVLLFGISVWLTAMGLQTIRVSCADGQCVYVVTYAGVTTREAPFTPSSGTVSWRRTGKGNNQGVVDILTAADGKQSISWLSAEDAEAAAHGLVYDPRFALTSTGPRWWLLFLLGTIPFMLSFVVAPKLRIAKLPPAPPVEQTKKAARAARGKAKKARERD